jgi:hypothetical protein
MTRRFVWTIGALLVGVFAVPSVARAQGCSMTWWLDTNPYGTSGVLLAEGVTGTQFGSQGCYVGHYQTEVWYAASSQTPVCGTAGSATGGWNGSACLGISSGAEPTQRAWAQAALYRYGCLTARSKHWFVNGGTQWNLMAERSGVSCGGSPPPPPREDDPYCDWTWNDYEGDYDWDCTSPILMPTNPSMLKALSRRDYRLTSVEDGVLFDHNCDGVSEQTAWTARASGLGFLTLDRNKNGLVDGGCELYGNHTYPGASNGFDALIVDAGRVGLVDSESQLYAQLELWTDLNHDGISQEHEKQPLSALYAAIGQSYERDRAVDTFGNAFAFKGNAIVRTGPGRNRARTAQEDRERLVDIWDVYFVTRPR